MVFLRKRGFVITLFSLTLLLILLTSSINVSALGVTPSRVIRKFEPNSVYKGMACFQPHKIAHLKLEVRGELKDFITLEKEELYVTEGAGCVRYELKMPERFDKPGIHKGSVTATETPEETGGAVFAVVRIHHQIWVEVPYPGKYLEIQSFIARNVKAGETVPFEAVAVSKGNQSISKAQGTILIYDKEDKIIGTVQTNVIENIEPDDTRGLSAEWDSGIYKQGNYHAMLLLTYDGLKNNESTKFKLGGLDVELVDYTKEVIIGGIKEFYLTVDSIWSEAITNLKANVSVYNYSKSSEPLTSFETLTRTLAAWKTETIKGYLDTTPLNLGDYDLKIVLLFANLSKEYDGNLSIIEEPPEPEPEKPGFFSRLFSSIPTLKVINIILIALLIIMFIILLYILIPKKKEKKEEKKKEEKKEKEEKKGNKRKK